MNTGRTHSNISPNGSVSVDNSVRVGTLTRTDDRGQETVIPHHLPWSYVKGEIGRLKRVKRGRWANGVVPL